MSNRTTGIDACTAHPGASGDGGSVSSRFSWGLCLACGVGALAALGVWSATQATSQDRSIAGAWSRAVESSPGLVQAFVRGDAHGANLHPVSSSDSGRPLVIGDRLTIVTPEGAILTLRVCDPASPSSATTSDCLNALVSRAVPPPATPVPQRSL